MIEIGLDKDRWSSPPPAKAAIVPAVPARELEYQQGLGWVMPPSIAGVSVSHHSANSITAYWNGIVVISGDIGALDRHVYRRVGNDDRERATSLPAYSLVHDEPNDDTTGMVFWETFVSHVVGWGNGYAEIEFDRATRPIALWLITPDLMEPKVELVTDRAGRTRQRKYYLYRGTTRLEAEDVLHVPGLGFDGVRGYSPVQLFRRSLGLSIAMEEFGSSLFGNGAWPGLALEHPGTLTDPAHARLRESIENRHQGPRKAHRTIILEEGMKVSKPITIPPDDAQFLETRSFSVEEMARILNLPPHKLKHKVNERPGGNFEASELDYQVTTLVPLTTKIEQECDRKLIAKSQRGTYYTEHNFQKRLKADTNTRMNSYKTLSDIGAIDADSVARFENLPKPKPKKQEEQPVAPAKVDPPAQDPAPPTVEPQRQLSPGRAETAQRDAILAEVSRFMRREAENAQRAAVKGADGFGKWAARFYGADEEHVLTGSLVPPLGLCLAMRGSSADGLAVAQGFARAYLEQSKGELEDLKTRDLAAGVDEVLKRWKATRAKQCVDALMAALDTVEEEKHAA